MNVDRRSRMQALTPTRTRKTARLLVIAALGTIVLGACTNEPASEPTAPSTTQAPSTTNPAAPSTTSTTTTLPVTTTTVAPTIDWQYVEPGDLPVLEVLDAGQEPLRTYRYDLEPGSISAFVMRNGMRIEQSIDGMAPTEFHTSLATEWMNTVLYADDTGFTVEHKLGAFVATADDPAARVAMDEAYEDIAGSTTYSFISPEGVLLAIEASELPPDAEDLTMGLAGATVPIPAEPLGVGAVWRSTSTVQSNGVEFIQTSTTTLVSVNGDVLTVEIDTTQSLGPDGFQMAGIETTDIEYSAQGSGTAVWDLTAPGTSDASTSVDQYLNVTLIAGNEKAILDQTLSMSMDIDPGQVDHADGVLRVAFVHVGPVDDTGWTWSHDQGAQYLKAQLGDAVEITTLEFVPEGPSSTQVFADLASLGAELIFGTSFGYMDSMEEVSSSYPDVVFMHATGYKTTPNLGNYFGASEEGRYLSGMVAGSATNSDLIGYVAAFPVPEVIRGINAFALGAQEVNPDAVVQVVWTSTWFDPPAEAAAARSLLEVGADVIAMHQDSAASGLMAESRDAGWIGSGTDMMEAAPEAWLTASTWDWGPFYLATASQVIDGIWVSDSHYGNMASGMVLLAPFGDSVDRRTRNLVRQRQSEIVAGTFSIFPDPIIDQHGDTRPLGDIFIMDYFVQGVVGDPNL